MKNQDSTGLNSPLWIANWSGLTWVVVVGLPIFATLAAFALK